MVSSALENAWIKREKSGEFEKTQALRIFHGPSEGEGFLQNIAIDQFGEHAWVTEWESSHRGQAHSSQTQSTQASSVRQAEIEGVTAFLKSKNFKSAVALFRPERDIPSEPEVLFGNAPDGRFEVSEGKAKFWIQLLKAKHPGLFLDHFPLRSWLLENAKGWKVLNTFAYTGSLSVASGLGGASHVTTLDLSKPTIEWAKANWALNLLPAENADFIFGDYFEWLPKMTKRNQKFDCVILDPPSYSRGKKGDFSTSRDLERLHEAAIDVLAPKGILITSLNSANVSKKKYQSEIQAACKKKGVSLSIVEVITLPSTFPTRAQEEPYLKGWILKRS